jgi:hypothetical protein
MGVQKHYKNVLQKKIVWKRVLKKIDQKSKTHFILICFCFYHVFGCFPVGGVQKHPRKYRKNKSGLGPFFGESGPGL